jgi:hypothetical protein
MNRWEYKYIRDEGHGRQNMALLVAAAGRDGWELVCVNEQTECSLQTYYFKRPFIDAEALARETIPPYLPPT